MQDGFYKSRRAATAIGACLLAAYTGNSDEVALAVSPNTPIAGVNDNVDVPLGQQADVQMTQLADVRFGAGGVAPGDPVTTDAQGRAVKAVKQNGAIVWVAGIAQRPQLEGDIGPILVAPFMIVG
jgi:hypothetical protein